MKSCYCKYQVNMKSRCVTDEQFSSLIKKVKKSCNKQIKYHLYIAYCNLVQLKSLEASAISDQVIYDSFRQIERAFWFYNDNVKKPYNRFRNLYTFSNYLCSTISKDHMTKYIRQYHLICSQIPVAGVILICQGNPRILMVKNTFSNCWSFPKGKIEPGETPKNTAIRECLEETGYDISDRIDSAPCICFQQNNKKVHLFIINNVPYDYSFKAHNKHEIANIQWKVISDDFATNKSYNKQISISYKYICQFLQSNNIPYRSSIRETVTNCRPEGPEELSSP